LRTKMFISWVCCVCCVGCGLCVELITRFEESYRPWVCLIVYDLETSEMRRPRADLGCCTTKNIGAIPRHSLSVCIMYNNVR